MTVKGHKFEIFISTEKGKYEDGADVDYEKLRKI